MASQKDARARNSKQRRQKKQNQKRLQSTYGKTPPDCYCGAHPVLSMTSEIVYGRDHGPVWICGRWPACESMIGCHPDSTIPLGTLATREVRAARKMAHGLFDRVFQSGRMTRAEAYRELAAVIDLPVRQTHIGMFTLGQCEHAAAWARAELQRDHQPVIY